MLLSKGWQSVLVARQIHWRSVPGSSTTGAALDIANRGQIRFRRTSADACVVKLTIAYEVPDVLAPLAGVRPHVPLFAAPGARHSCMAFTSELSCQNTQICPFQSQ